MKVRYKNLYILAKMLNRQKELKLSFNKIKGYEENKVSIPPPEKTLSKNKDKKKGI